MTKITRFLAGCALAGGVALALPGTAQAQFWIGDNFTAGWGWGPYLYYGWSEPSATYQIFPPPARFYDDVPAVADECAWVRVRDWRDGYREWRRVRRCR